MATYTPGVDYDGGPGPSGSEPPPVGGAVPGQTAPPPGYTPPVYTPPAYPAPPDPAPQQAGQKGKRGGIVGGLISFGVLLLKLGASLKFILIPLAKAPFLLSILLNIGIYTWVFGRHNPLYGLAFATGFVALIFVHEMGHLIAARYEGVEATAPFFVPFMGAAIFLRQNPRDARSEAIIGIGGPITGTLGALAVFGAAQAVGSLGDPTLGLLLARLAFYGFFINLFNMIPMSPLDGGRILGAVSKWFNVVGLGLIVLLMVTGIVQSFLLLIVLGLGAIGVWMRFTRPEHPGYYNTSLPTKAVIGLSYLALLAVLVGGIVATEVYVTPANF
jgi:Zn-dependent protease